MVAIYHASHYANAIRGDAAFEGWNVLGLYGVSVFFVISGFVIPYSLYRGGYRLPQYGKFVLKRIIRLDPPYLVTIILILALGFLSRVLPYAKVGEFHVTATQVFLHLEAGFDSCPHGFIKDLHSATAPPLRLVHRHVGVAEHLVGG